MFNGKLFLLQTLSGYRGPTDLDPRGVQLILDGDIDNQTLGQGVLDCISKSRFVLPRKRTDVVQHPLVEFDEQMYDKEILRASYKHWTSQAIERLGFKGEKEIFKHMKFCGIEVIDSVMTISPTRHDSLFEWSREKSDGIEDVVISMNLSSEDIGAALRIGFNRCRGT